MNGKVVSLALLLILAASGTSVALQAATGRVDRPAAGQATSATPRPNGTEDATLSADATELVITPDLADCPPIAATPEATLSAIEEATSAGTLTPTVTPDCLPSEATPEFTPEATSDDVNATLEATEDSGHGRGRGGDDDEDDDDDHSGKGKGGSGSDNSGRGGGDD